MSKLNPGASTFVPGKGFVPVQPQQPLPPPIERPEQTEAPTPAPTISLNIGGSAPARPPVPAAQTPPPVIQPPAPQADAPPKPPATKIVKADAAPSSKTFTTEKAKTDTNAIAAEVKALVDESTLQDLYGNGEFVALCSIEAN